MVRLRYFWMVGAIAGLTLSCFQSDLDNAELPKWNPSFAFPVVTAHFTAADILKSAGARDYVKGDSNQVLQINYSQRIFSKTGPEIFKLPDFKFDFPFPEDTLKIQIPFPGGDIIKKLDLDDFHLQYQLESVTPITWEDGDIMQIKITIPQAVRDGVSFTKIISLAVSNGSVYQYSGELDLSGYSLHLAKNGDSKNLFSIVLEAINTRTGEIAVLDRFAGQWKKAVYSYLEGYLSQLTFPDLNDTIDLKLQNWLSGSVTLVNPRIQVLIENSFGFPIQAKFSNFRSTTSSGSFQLQGEFINKGFTAPSSLSGAPVSSAYEANSYNSNVHDFLSITPQRINYQLKLYGDFMADFSSFNYITDTSRVTVDVNVEIPLECSINNAILRDTIDIKVDSIRQLTSLDLKMITENSFPYSIQLQVYLTDAEHNVIDSLFAPGEDILSSGLIGDKGEVVRPVEKISWINLSTTRLQNLFQSSAMIVQARVVTSSEGKRIVRYTADNGLKIKIGAVTGITP